MGNPELNVEPLLYSLVFGESVLNDAVAIVLFKTFSASFEAGDEFSAGSLYSIMINFSIVSLGSVAVGVIIGLLCSYLCKHTALRLYPEYEISLLFLFAYGSFAFSEALELSGIMSLFFNGIILSHYNSYNLSPISQVTAHNIFKSLAVLSEYFVFLYIGMGLFTGRFRHFHVSFVAVCIVFCLLGRVANILPLSVVANLFRRNKIPIKMQMVMWFAGLRGAIAFALSQNMPFEHRELYVSTTLLIVIATTLICGSMTEPMLSSMGMRIEKAEVSNSNIASSAAAGGSILDGASSGVGAIFQTLSGIVSRGTGSGSGGSCGRHVELKPDPSKYEVSECSPDGWYQPAAIIH
jgi:sodium/hydrogen exchanger 8